MRSRTVFLAALLLGLAPLATHAQITPATAPLLQKYVGAVQDAKAFSVAVTLFDANDQATDTAYLAFTRPNQLRIVSRVSDEVIATLVSDGDTLWQWNKKYYRRRDAPASLDQINPTVPMGHAAKLARALFLTRQALGNLAAWHDTGAAKMDGIAAHKLVSGGGMAVWLAASTGLPLKLTVHSTGDDYSATFTYPSLNKDLPDDTFVASVPPGLELPPLPALPTDPNLLAAGSPAPDFSLADASGKTVTLSDFHGKVVLVDFWASWCPYCLDSMPGVQKIASELGDKGLVVLSINSWDQPADARQFIQDHPQFTTRMLFDPGSQENSIATGRYKAGGLPTAYLIDTEGRVAASWDGYSPDYEGEMRDAITQLGVH